VKKAYADMEERKPSSTHDESELGITGTALPAAIEPQNPEKEAHEIQNVERVVSRDVDNDLKNYGADVSRVDNEVQQYAAMGQVEVDEETNRRLRNKIDRRVLVFMIITYFLQAIDKGTLAFTSIMGLPKDTNLVGQQVSAVLPAKHDNSANLYIRRFSTPGLRPVYI
jgi:hypothetical protein